MSFVIARQQLYDLVWSEPMQRPGKQIGISDVAIAKACRKAGIPVPERGYWAKLQSGKKVAKVPLVPRDLITSDWIEMSGNLPEALKSRVGSAPNAEDPPEDVAVLTEHFAKRLGQVSVPRNLGRAHPLIEKLLAKDEEIRQKKATERF
jgi:hypothetical protein